MSTAEAQGGKTVSVWMPQTLIKELENYRWGARQSRSEAVVTAVEEFLAKKNKSKGRKKK